MFLVVWWLISSSHHKNQRKEGLGLLNNKNWALRAMLRQKKETQRQGDFKDNSLLLYETPPLPSPFAIVMKKWV
jgi:hypothetical protein